MLTPRTLKSEVLVTNPLASPLKMVKKMPLRTVTQTPPKDSGFISSSPRTPISATKSKPRSLVSAGARVRNALRSPTGTLFSPTYPSRANEISLQSWEAAMNDPEPHTPTRVNSNAEPEEKLTPVQRRLKENVALYGHIDQEFDTYEDGLFDPYRFIASLPPLPASQRREPSLPNKNPETPKMTLVLDLDETLVHCSTDSSEIHNADFTFEVVFNNTVYQVNCRKRPGFDEFFEHIKGRFEIVIFTASQQVYADKLLDLLDPNQEVIKYRLFRHDCVCVEGNYLKDLNVLGRDLSRAVIVDNSPQAFSYQLDNGIPILSWFESDEDRELYKLIPLLDQLSSVEDVRPVLRSRFRLYRKVDERKRFL